MNILHVIPDLSRASGGPVTALFGMAQAQTKLGHRVAIASTDIGYEPEDAVKGTKLHLFPSEFPRWRRSNRLATALPSLIGKADMVHLHMIWDYPVLAAAGLCQRSRKPYVLRPCGMLDAWSLSQRAWKKKLYLYFMAHQILKNASGIHFTSENECRNSKVSGISEKGFIVPLGVSEFFYEPFKGDPWIEKYPQLRGKKILLFLSRLHYKKQPEVALGALKVLSDKHPDVFLVMAGGGETNYVADLKKQVSDLKLTEKVLFTGMLGKEVCRAAYHGADLFVLPSLQENFGLSVAEAMAAGCPVVVSNKVDLAPMIQKAEAGLVCDPTVDSTASAIHRLLNDAGLRQRLGDHGRQFIQEKLTWDKLMVALQAVYEDILAGRRQSPAWTRRGSL